mmetsp:Transcript_37934/g.65422  ORF Transcript_37934/g.65422 Transcript_37934/m.65422 type:complete len:166 (+) Transcript_37934:61-558(+)
MRVCAVLLALFLGAATAFSPIPGAQSPHLVRGGKPLHGEDARRSFCYGTGDTTGTYGSAYGGWHGSSQSVPLGGRLLTGNLPYHDESAHEAAALPPANMPPANMPPGDMPPAKMRRNELTTVEADPNAIGRRQFRTPQQEFRYGSGSIAQSWGHPSAEVFRTGGP